MTLREVFRECVIAKQRRQDEQDRDLSLAWHTALLTRQEKLPPLKQLLTQRAAHRPQTIAQQRTMLQALSEAYHLPIRQTKLKRVTRERTDG